LKAVASESGVKWGEGGIRTDSTFFFSARRAT
jgi:hypothetical protein